MSQMHINDQHFKIPYLDDDVPGILIPWALTDYWDKDPRRSLAGATTPLQTLLVILMLDEWRLKGFPSGTFAVNVADFLRRLWPKAEPRQRERVRKSFDALSSTAIPLRLGARHRDDVVALTCTRSRRGRHYTVQLCRRLQAAYRYGDGHTFAPTVVEKLLQVEQNAPGFRAAMRVLRSSPNSMKWGMRSWHRHFFGSDTQRSDRVEAVCQLLERVGIFGGYDLRAQQTSDRSPLDRNVVWVPGTVLRRPTGVSVRLYGRLSCSDVVSFLLGSAPNSGKLVCPFHDDRTASLAVASDHYHCYGCDDHGSAYKFVRRWRRGQGLPVNPSALRSHGEDLAATLLGQAVVTKSMVQNGVPAVDLWRWVADLLPLATTDPEARDYLEGRGIRAATADGADIRILAGSILTDFHRRGVAAYGSQTWNRLGWSRVYSCPSREGGFVIYPWTQRTGDVSSVVCSQARALHPRNVDDRYTWIGKPGGTLFGIESIGEDPDVYVAEGFFDTLVLRQEGMNAVGLPTRTTDIAGHATELAGRRVVLCHDIDAGDQGQAARVQSVCYARLLEEGCESVATLDLPAGVDVSELSQRLQTPLQLELADLTHNLTQNPSPRPMGGGCEQPLPDSRASVALTTGEGVAAIAASMADLMVVREPGRTGWSLMLDESGSPIWYVEERDFGDALQDVLAAMDAQDGRELVVDDVMQVCEALGDRYRILSGKPVLCCQILAYHLDTTTDPGLFGRNEERRWIFERISTRPEPQAAEDLLRWHRRSQSKAAESLCNDAVLWTTQVAIALSQYRRYGFAVDTAEVDAQMSQLTDTIAGLRLTLSDPKVNLASRVGRDWITETILRPNRLITKVGAPTQKRLRRVTHVDTQHLADVMESERGLARLESLRRDVIGGAIRGGFGIGTVNGRVRCQRPNLQGLTKSGPVRGLLRASPSRLLIVADFSNIDLRVLAHVTKDARLTAHFMAGEDVHLATARLLFDDDTIEREDERRAKAKEITFAMVYGSGPRRIAHELDITLGEAKGLLDEFNLRFPETSKAADRLFDDLRRADAPVVESPSGRRRRIWQAHAANASDHRKKEGRRQAWNCQVSGFTADIVAQKMLDIDALDLPMLPISMVHDELVFSAAGSDVDSIVPTLIETLETPVFGITVPLKVEVKVGENYGELRLWDELDAGVG